MNRIKQVSKPDIILYGLVVAIAYLYFNEFIYMSRLKPDRIDQYAVRQIPSLWRDISYFIWKLMLCLSFPAGIMAGKIYEPYFTELAYYPFMAGPIWFGYGCLLRWAYVTKRLFIVLGVLMIVWVALVLFGWKITTF